MILFKALIFNMTKAKECHAYQSKLSKCKQSKGVGPQWAQSQGLPDVMSQFTEPHDITTGQQLLSLNAIPFTKYLVRLHSITIELKKVQMLCFEPRAGRMVGADGSTELWRPPYNHRDQYVKMFCSTGPWSASSEPLSDNSNSNQPTSNKALASWGLQSMTLLQSLWSHHLVSGAGTQTHSLDVSQSLGSSLHHQTWS